MTRKINTKIMATVAATALSAAFAGGAFAADLPSMAPAPAPYVAAPPVFTWTGFYIGVNAGVDFNGSLNPTFFPGAGAVAGAANQTPGATNTAGFTGGGQIGYNWQVSQFVFGLEGDLDYLSRSNVNGTYTSSLPAPGGAGSYTLAGGRRNQITGSIRGRLGYAIDRTLLYVTGGVAFGGNSAPDTLTFNSAPAGVATYTAQNNRNNNIGEVVGAGVEYAFTPNWTGRVEYLHDFFNNRRVNYVNNAGAVYSANGYKFDTNIIRVGLNYKF